MWGCRRLFEAATNFDLRDGNQGGGVLPNGGIGIAAHLLNSELGIAGEFDELLLEFGPEVFHVIEEFEDDVDSGEVDAEVLSESLDLFDPLDIVFAIQAVLGSDSCGDDEAEFFVLAEGLGVDPAELGGDADHVDRLLGCSHTFVLRRALRF